MSLFLKILLIIFGMAYLISPVDIIPDLLVPYIGWLDDGVVVWTIYYLLRYGRFPNYLSRQKNPFATPASAKTGQRQESGTQQQEYSANNQKSRKNNSSQDQQESHQPDPPSRPSAWEVLGIPMNSEKKVIQKAYKEAIKKYHPDKLSHLGEDFSSLANKKFLEIQNAYDELMNRY